MSTSFVYYAKEDPWQDDRDGNHVRTVRRAGDRVARPEKHIEDEKRRNEALAERTAHHLSEVYTWSDGSGDHDNYVVLRLEVVLDSKRWQVLPWGHRHPGELFYGWSHDQDEMIRDDPEGIGWKMASWEEVEQALAAGECRLEFIDGLRHLRKSLR